MKLATTYFKHPMTGEIIKPNDIYDDTFEAVPAIKKPAKKNSGKKAAKTHADSINKAANTNDTDSLKPKEGDADEKGAASAENALNA